MSGPHKRGEGRAPTIELGYPKKLCGTGRAESRVRRCIVIPPSSAFPRAFLVRNGLA